MSAAHGPLVLPTSFVGRKADLAGLSRTFDITRLVTLLGPPGVGKTRLARQYVALEGAAGRPPTVAFCDLTEVTSCLGICAAVAAALGVPMISGEAAAGAATALVTPMVARGALLLVLDNFEQLVEHATKTVGVWLGGAPETRFLVTSRERLGIAGEALFDLGPLSLPEGSHVEGSEAVQLFVQRARLVRKDYFVTPAEAPTVAELVRELDGLPLAIELCAARMRVLSPAQMLANMSRRFQFLSTEPRASAVDPRTRRGRALWQAIESSWTQLSKEEREVLASCAVFRGGFDLEAVEEIQGGAAGALRVLDTMQRLVDKSLIRVHEASGSAAPPRFSMYLAIREFAQRMLADSGAEGGAIQRHAAHYLRLGAARAEGADGPDAPVARAWLGHEMENLVAVHQRGLTRQGGSSDGQLPGPVASIEAALALVPLLVMRGPLALAISLLDEALAAVGDDLDPRLLARVLEAKGHIVRLCGRTSDAIAILEQARDIALGLDDRALLARSLHELGIALVTDTDWRRGRPVQEQALAIFRKLGDHVREGLALLWLADSYFFVDDLDQAERLYEEALAVLRAAGARPSEGATLGRMGSVAMERGDHAAARARLGDALRIQRETDDRRWECFTLGRLAILEQDAGRLAEARGHYDSALAYARRIGNGRVEAFLLAYQATCLQEQGRIAESRASLEQAIPLVDRLGLRIVGALARASLGALLADAGELDPATSLFVEAESLLEGLGEQRFTIATIQLHRGHLELCLARSAAASGDAIGAFEHRRSARRRLDVGQSIDGAQTDVRFARRSLARALQSEPALARGPAPDGFAADMLVIETTGAWFRPPHGRSVSLHHRQSLRHLLAELLHHRRTRPGEPVATEVLIRRAWPNEAAGDGVVVNRLRVAMSSLRKLGLSRAILTRPGGYLLDPSIDLQSPE